MMQFDRISIETSHALPLTTRMRASTSYGRGRSVYDRSREHAPPRREPSRGRLLRLMMGRPLC
jgi:hypothetical protein